MGREARVMVVALVVGVGMAVVAWSTPTSNSAGEQCASAWHFHPGSSRLVTGGELSDVERAAVRDECNRSGGVPWVTGWVALGAGAAVAAGSGAALAVTRSRHRAG